MTPIKLIASDLDRTLLTDAGEFPPHLFQRIKELKAVGIEFVAASGRPLYTLRDMFAAEAPEMALIADNGGVITVDGQVISKTLLPVTAYQEMVTFVERQGVGFPVICALEGAYLNRRYEAYRGEMAKFYTQVYFVDDLSTITAEANKVSIYFPKLDAVAQVKATYQPTFGENYAVTVGGPAWVDIMPQGVDKGAAIVKLGQHLGVTPAEMMAFGDTLNDAGMLAAVKYSYLVANGDDFMKKYANYRTASNNDFGVLQEIDKVLAAARAE
ncbi:Cof-type HAD-IIB family hydrolase [Lapidilactobacillus achengensis]|uniref:Cof-type HAD-IIB family hydrolase n=1 Tax=Lapidilactobacillus achengensis TaxID=2486000 RepID=A0ABW1UQS1_9LACO